MSDLKPNPFCGHAVTRDNVNSEYVKDIIGCEPDTCEACCDSFHMSDDEWNTRPIEDALRAELSDERDARTQAETMLQESEATVTALRAEVATLTAKLAMYEGSLTEDQEQRVNEIIDTVMPRCGRSVMGYDAAIRQVRRERGKA